MARRLVASRGATLVEVETEDGVVGIGEAGVRPKPRPPISS